MKKCKSFIFFLVILLYAFQVRSQVCPTPALTTIDPTDELCYQEEDGALVFTFNDGDPPDGINFRIRLADFDLGQVVWDDNAPFPLPNQVPPPIISGNTVTFQGLRPGDYVLALSDGDCGPGSNPTLYGVGYTGPADIGIRLEAAPFLGGTLNPPVSSVCEGSVTTLTLSGHTGQILRWEYSTDNFLTDINDLGNAGNTTYDVTGLLPGIYQFRVVIDVVDCPNQFSVISEVTVIPLDDPSFSYPQASYCQGDTNPLATITGLAGGTFTGPAAIVFANVNTGEINLTASTPGGPYTITYTTAGPCPNSTTFNVTINPEDNPSFSYPQINFCEGDLNPVATISGTPGGTFTGPVEIVFADVNTGEIDLGASVLGGPYTITYTTPGPDCPNIETFEISILPLDDPSFSYPQASYCQGDANPLATITGLAGGTFTGPAAIVFANVNTGEIDLAASTVGGPYTITYTTAGPCPNSTTFDVTINPEDDPSFSYPQASYCQGDANPVATVTGTPGGTFTGPTEIVFTDINTGEVNLAASTPGGPYSVTYTTPGPDCPNIETFEISILPLDDPSFSYPQASYCQGDTNPLATITGLAGGTFTGPAAIVFANVNTGEIDLAASTVGGPYTITYTTAGPCPNSTTFDVTINPEDDPSFSYPQASYCQGDANPVATVTGTPGGTFTGPAEIVFTDINTGEVNLAASTPGGPYSVTYTTPGPDCPNSATYEISILPLDDPSFSYPQASYCQGDTNPLATITGLAGGTFTGPAAIVFANVNTGEIDLAASTVGGPYTITYTTAGPCPNSTTFDVTINPEDDPSFSYPQASYCQGDANPVATVTGTPGGTFTGPTEIVFTDINTGEVNLAASTPGGPYSVTYTTPGPDCPNIETFEISILPLDDPSFSYPQASYCQGDTNPLATITGLAGGTFTGPAAIVFANVNTGEIDLAASTVGGPYTITYTTAGPCPNSTTFDVTINPEDDPSFSYPQASYCQGDANPVATVTGTPGGTFTGPAEIVFTDINTGEVNLAASTPGGPYSVTYTTPGPDCPNSATYEISILPLDDPSFSYPQASYCQGDTNPLATITGLAGGTFTGPAAIVFANVNTGEIDLAASTVGGPYTITYTTAGPCPNNTTFDVTINPEDDPSFSYPQASYCQGDANPVATVTGTPGGTFTGPAEIVFTDINTGEVNLAASTPGGPYSVTYTTPGPDCPNIETFEISILPLDDPSFSYPQASYCQGDANPLATITGLAGGTFTGPAAIVFANVNTGEIDLAASTVGGPYTITYTTPGPCISNTTYDISILPVQNVSFSLNNLSGNNGDQILIPVIVQGFTDIQSAQFTLQWDPAIIQLMDVENLAGLTDLDLTNFNSPDAQTLIFTWSTAPGQSLADGLSLFDMRFELIGQSCNSSTIRFIGSPVPILVTDNNLCNANVVITNGSIGVLGTGVSDAPLVAFGDTVNCINDPIPVLSVSGVNIKWYADPALTILVATTNDYIPAIDNTDLADTVFYATQTIGTCSESLPDSSRIQYITVPEPPSIPQPVYTLCLFAAPPSLVASGTNVQWFADNTLTIKLADGNTFIPAPGELDTSVEGTTIFYVTQDNQCGMSSYSEVQVDMIDCGVNCNDFETTASAQNTSCPESKDGTIDITVTVPVSGTNQFSLDGGITYFDFNNPNSTQTPDTLSVGTYEILVRALGSGCYPDTSLVNIESQVIFTTTIDKVEPTCGMGDGEITFSVAGGSGDYSYTLHLPNGSVLSNTSGVFTGLRSGVYQYDLLDNNSGCTLTLQEIILNDSNAITATADPDSFENALCYGEPMGRAIINVSGGSDNSYEYSLNGNTWTDFISGEYIENLPPNGTYIVLIRQSAADLCFEQVQVTINNEYPPTDFAYSSTMASCDLEDGSISIDTITGGAAPYEISIDFDPFIAVDLNNLPVFNNLSGGFKNIRIQDVNGCIFENDQVFVDFPGYLIADVQHIPPTCAGEGKDGIVSVFIGSNVNTILPPYQFGFASAGTPENEVVLQPIIPDNLVTIDTLGNGSYYVLFSPANGCPSRMDIDVAGGPFAIDFTVSQVNDAACKGGTGSILIENITGDVNSDFTIELIAMPSLDPVFSADFTYGDISGGLTIDGTLANGFTAGEYRIQIRQDQNGCELVAVSDNFMISEPDEYFDFNVTGIENSLKNLPTGSISILLLPSGSEPYETSLELRTPFFPGQEIIRDWTGFPGGSGNYSFTHEELYSGIYEVSVRDQLGCLIMQEVTVGYDSALLIPNIFTPNGDNYNDYFEISNLPKSGSGTSLVITNRWGNIIFESDDYNENNLWNGGDYPDGTYFYRLNIPNQGSYSGWIEIWRGH